jgi:hypothetical protein
MKTAPWTKEEVKNLEARQEILHPYTCVCGDHIALVPTINGWKCPKGCGYKQSWAHKDDLNGVTLEWELKWEKANQW